MTVATLGALLLMTDTSLAAPPAPTALQATVEPQEASSPVSPVASPAPTPATPVALPDAAPATAEPIAPDSAAQDPAPSGTGNYKTDGDIVVTARRRSSAADPLEAINAQSFETVQAVDRALVGPLAKGYEKAVPRVVRRGVHNFLDNIRDPVVFLNYLLQFKPGKAAETLGRFTINSTVGVAGLFDIAKRRPFRLPHRPNSFGDTLGYYGVKPGPYLFLPLIGPTTVRDLVGLSVDRLVLPLGIGKPFTRPEYNIPVNVLSALDYRVAFDEKLKAQRASSDPYAAGRAYYLARRQAEIDGLHSAEWRARHAPPIINPISTPAPRVTLPDTGRTPG